jgi:hypothetical protein
MEAAVLLGRGVRNGVAPGLTVRRASRIGRTIGHRRRATEGTDHDRSADNVLRSNHDEDLARGRLECVTAGFAERRRASIEKEPRGRRLKWRSNLALSRASRTHGRRTSPHMTPHDVAREFLPGLVVHRVVGVAQKLQEEGRRPPHPSALFPPRSRL